MIELPDTAKNVKPKHFQVVAVGSGMFTGDGKQLPPTVKVGEVILISQRASTAEVNVIAGQTVITIREMDILGVVADD
jgi:chaperonin GroES